MSTTVTTTTARAAAGTAGSARLGSRIYNVGQEDQVCALNTAVTATTGYRPPLRAPPTMRAVRDKGVTIAAL